MPRCSIVAGILSVIILFFLREWMQAPDGKLHVHFLNVGQGESSLIVGPRGETILIDGGPDLSVLERLGDLLPFLHRHIDLLVLTTPTRDRIMSFPEILRRHAVGHVVLSGMASDLSQYALLLEEVRRQGTPVIAVSAGQTIDIGTLRIDVLWLPPAVGKIFSDPTDGSLILRLSSGDHRFLLMGNATEKQEKKLLKAGVDLHADVLLAGHYGSRATSGTGFLLTVRPRLVVIDGITEKRQPHADVLARFTSLGIPVTTTASGTVSLVFPR